MQRLTATLPTLGTVPVDFHAESEAVLDFIGKRELDRLHRVPHLGVAASVFTGISHSRLEYMLLQCALAGLIGKLYRDNPAFALSGKVQLSGIAKPISSGEELLKCWALLSNYGHAQYTYGVERSLLQAARMDRSIERHLLSGAVGQGLRDWCRSAIHEYHDGKIHYLISLYRIRRGPRNDRRKSLCRQLLRNLLLPLEVLYAGDHAQQYKIGRLRGLYSRIRLMSMTALDSYYSHNPFRLQLNSALVSLAELTADPGEQSRFDSMLREAAGWLADELYLHSRATTAQREYEIRAADLIPKRLAAAGADQSRQARLIDQWILNGFGRPSARAFEHLLRMTFERPRQPLLGRSDLFKILGQLERELVSPPLTYATIDRNRFSKAVHIDLMYRVGHARASDIAITYCRVARWLIRLLEADALAHVRSTLHQADRNDDALVKRLRQEQFGMRLMHEEPLLRSLFASVLRYLLPENRRGLVHELLPGDGIARTVWPRLITNDGAFDQASAEIERQILDNPRGYDADRLQELRAIKHVLRYVKAPFALVCIEKFIVRDPFGRSVDDWDGVVLEISDNCVRVTIVEAKNLASTRRNESEAMKQLAATAELLCGSRGLTYRRKRIPGLGARLVCTLDGA